MGVAKPGLSMPEPRAYDWSVWEEKRTCVQFRDNKLCMFDMGGRVPDEKDRKNFEQVRRKTYQGKMTRGAQKRMSKALTNLSLISPEKWKTNPATGKLFLHKLSFITLTVSEAANIDSKAAQKKLLHPFLDWLTRTKHVRNYVWKAELQKRGQIHYHVICSAVIHWAEIRRKWNRLQVAAGYLDRYAEKRGHTNANSTDIHMVNSVELGTDYMMKELGKDADAKVLVRKKQLAQQLKRGQISKDDFDKKTAELDEQLATINGKVWDCTVPLSDPYFHFMLTRNMYLKLKSFYQRYPAQFTIGERFALCNVNYDKPPPWLKMYLPSFKAYLHVIASGGIRAMQAKYN